MKTIELTVAQLLELDGEGKLHYDQTTQRNFIYNSVPVVEDGTLTKAGDVIKSCLEGVEFPPIILWHVTGEEDTLNFVKNEYNVHDGKQRYLSFKYFLMPGTDGITVRTLLDGRGECGLLDLTEEEQDKLANYTFSVQVREGTLREEELSFYKLNTTALPLTPYEGLRGSYHGTFLYGFEEYINNIAYTEPVINEIGKDRGDQALWLLGLYFNMFDMEKSFKRDLMIKKLQDRLQLVRGNVFDSKYKDFDKKVELYINLRQLYLKSGTWLGLPSKDSCKNFSICQFVIENKYNTTKVENYYRSIVKDQVDNDLSSWTLPTHKEALESLARGIECDGKRKPNRNNILELTRKTPRCPSCGVTFDLSNVTLDHIVPWKEGGKTSASNLRLLCRSCNSSKGAKMVTVVGKAGK